MTSVITSSSTPTAGPFVLLMSSSMTRHPSTLEYHQADPSSGPMFSFPVMRLPPRSAHASLHRPPITSGYSASSRVVPRSGSMTCNPSCRTPTSRPSSVGTIPAGIDGGRSVWSSSSSSSSQCNVCAAQSTKYNRRRCSSHTRLSPHPNVKLPTRLISIAPFFFTSVGVSAFVGRSGARRDSVRPVVVQPSSFSRRRSAVVVQPSSFSRRRSAVVVQPSSFSRRRSGCARCPGRRTHPAAR